MAQRKSAHKHILVIEDQLEILDSIGRITEPEDLIVHVIKSLEDYQAFVVQPKVDFSAIILDRHLKFKDSLEVLSQLKRQASWVNIPVLMMAKAFQERCSGPASQTQGFSESGNFRSFPSKLRVVAVSVL